MFVRRSPALAVVTALAALAGFSVVAQRAIAQKQAASAVGRVYAQNCASCHGDALGGRFAPPLKGAAFVAQWGKKPVGALADYIRTTMPPANANSLSPANAAALAGYLRAANGLAGAPPPKLPVKPPVKPAAALPGKAGPSSVAPKNTASEMKTAKADANPLSVAAMPDDPFVKAQAERLAKLAADLRPVSDEMLSQPAAANWPTWRRSHALNGFTPLDQIDKSNASRLGVAWALSLKPGTDGIEPLVEDGIIFLNSGGEVQALDGTTGDVIWQYSRTAAPVPMPLSQSRGMTLYGTNLYVPTLDGHMLALDARTGTLVWDHEVKKRPGDSFILTGAPLAAKGKIIQGTSGCFGESNPGGCFIFAMDARDGRELWRFNSIARPSTPEGDSWNGAPLEKRFGGSVWTGGSYDPDLNLVFFGVGQTYKITTLLNPRPAGSNATHDALYTDSTLALDPDTGALVWHYQHMRGDVWDLDWAFERTLVSLPGPDGPQKAIVTASKGAIVDVLDARTGKYLWSSDLGIQSLVTAIDPVTGEKTIDPKQVPVRGEMRTVCPSALGGRNWPASAVSPQQHLIVFPLLEACMDIGLESSASLGDFKLVTRARPDTDGKFGRILALDLNTRQFRWVDRMRAAPASAILTTAGGIVFEGGRDRWFRARDEASGDILWQSRLDDAPNGFPISYAVGGRQYVAVVTGGNTPYDLGVRGLTPEIRHSPGGRTLWTFALPEGR